MSSVALEGALIMPSELSQLGLGNNTFETLSLCNKLKICVEFIRHGEGWSKKMTCYLM